MRCIHCGQVIAPDSRFCATCGGTQPQYPPVPPRTQAKKKINVLPIIAFVWLGIAVLGWILTLLLMPSRAKTPAQAVNNEQIVSLTEGTWYQWDVSRGKLYQWRFSGGVAEFGQAEGERSQQADYSVDSDGNVYIGIDAEGLVWEKDSQENCYWQYVRTEDQICKIRIFCADQIPAGSAACYTYRVDNGTADISPVYEKVTRMDMDVATERIFWFNSYLYYGACNNTFITPRDEQDAALRSAGYDESYLSLYGADRVSCCNTLAQSHAHMNHYLGGSILQDIHYWGENPVEYNGHLYLISAPMGYPGLSIDGKLTDCGDGTWTLPLAEYESGDMLSRWTATFAMEDGTIKLISVERD